MSETNDENLQWDARALHLTKSDIRPHLQQLSDQAQQELTIAQRLRALAKQKLAEYDELNALADQLEE
jgi:hypothetical protein